MLSFLLAILLLVLGCTAPHDNPLDPDSNRYVPPQPVGRCCYGNQQCADTTETRCDELGGSWDAALTCATSCPTPYVPDFSARVWSEHYPVGQASEIYQLRIEFYNPDPSFTLDSVGVIYDGWLPRSLSVDTTGRIWGRNLDWTVFGCGQQMACVMGEPFDFFAYRGTVGVYHLGPLYLFRVIAAVPAVNEPDSGDTVGPHVRLEWPAFSAYFGFGFRANLVRTDTVWTWTSSLLPSDQYLVHPAPDSLPDGNYYWTLSVVDSFGNFARSQKAYFNVLFGGVPE